ncbi:hypothetical protein ACQ4M3_25625 [Leptolyngbya sp. AN03gr2]
MQLNHDRYAEEVAQGLHNKKKPRGKGNAKQKKPDDSPQDKQISLF